MPSILALIYFIFRAFQRSKSTLFRLLPVGKYSQTYLQNDLIEAAQKVRLLLRPPIINHRTHVPSQYPDTPFLIPDILDGPRTLILPVRYLNELKSLPKSKLSFIDAIYHRFSGKYSTLGVYNEVMVTSFKVDLAHNIARTLEALQDEADLAIPECIGACEDWTPIQFYPKVLRVIALLAGRIFVGLPLSRNEEWIQATMNYTMAAFACVVPIKKLSPLTRFLFAPKLPEVQRVREYRA